MKKVIIKGGGDLGSGVAHRLFMSGFNVIILDKHSPSTIRRKVAFAEAININEIVIEGVKGIKATAVNLNLWQNNYVPVIPSKIEEQRSILSVLQPDILVDATLKAIDNNTTQITDAPLTIGIGPGFTAGKDVHFVIETARGHYLGKVIDKGTALPNTTIPGNIGGYTVERLLKAPTDGIIKYTNFDIGDTVTPNDIVCYVNNITVKPLINGVIRGLISNNSLVKNGQKIGDIDPRNIKEYAFTISDKARAIGGGVLEAILRAISVGKI